jgi:hypothetical protein
MLTRVCAPSSTFQYSYFNVFVSSHYTTLHNINKTSWRKENKYKRNISLIQRPIMTHYKIHYTVARTAVARQRQRNIQLDKAVTRQRPVKCNRKGVFGPNRKGVRTRHYENMLKNDLHKTDKRWSSYFGVEKVASHSIILCSTKILWAQEKNLMAIDHNVRIEDTNSTNSYLARWYSCNALGYYSGATRFESVPCYQLYHEWSTLMIFFSLSLSRKFHS